MPDQELHAEMIRRISRLEKEIRELSIRKSLFEIKNQVTLPQITADQNNYDVGDYDSVLLSSNASRTITGISGGYPGRALFLRNNGGFNIILAYNSGSSLAANRIFAPGGASVTMTPFATGTRTSVLMIYAAAWVVYFLSAP